MDKPMLVICLGNRSQLMKACPSEIMLVLSGEQSHEVFNDAGIRRLVEQMGDTEEQRECWDPNNRMSGVDAPISLVNQGIDDRDKDADSFEFEKKEQERQEAERKAREAQEAERKAREVQEAERKAQETQVVTKKKPVLKSGNIVTFGQYPQFTKKVLKSGLFAKKQIEWEKEDIQWIVLYVNKDRALLLSWYALDVQPYNQEWKDITWKECTLRKWLNNGFLEVAFNKDQREMISTATVINADNEEYHTPGGKDTQDKIFLLSIDEVRKYLPSDKDRVCKPTDYALWREKGIVDKDFGAGCWWWLRSPGGNRSRAAYVGPSGFLDDLGNFVDGSSVAVRPAFWVNLES